MIKTQILEAIKQMPNSDRLEVIEFALKMLRQDIDKPEKLSLREAAAIMRPFYAENSNLLHWQYERKATQLVEQFYNVYFKADYKFRGARHYA